MAASVPPQSPEVPELSSAETNKYQSNLMIYPSNLYGDQELMNYVKFWINVQEDAKIAKNTSIVSGTSPSKSAMNSLVGKSIDKTNVAINSGIIGGVTGALAGGSSGIAGSAGKNGMAALGANLKGGFTGSIKGAIGGGLAAAGATGLEMAALEVADINFGKSTKRLKDAIALYTPNQLSVRYGTSWGEEEVDMAMALAANSSPSSLEANDKPLRSLAGAFVLGKNAGASAASRTAANPRKEQVFKGVDYRRFTFEYQFAPKDEAEAANALNIIYLFKYHMHPEFKDGTANFIYIYPSEFDIEYYIGGDQNVSIHQHSSCVLTEMNINYAPNGVFNTFPDGTPTIINMTLSFVELEMLTKERILQGL